MVLLLTVGVGVLSYVLVQRNRITNKDDIRINADKDLEEAVVKLGTLLITPANCNANFYGKPSAGSLTNISSCPSGNCASASSGVVEMGVFVPTDTNWKNATVALGGTGISERVRINAITYSISTPQGMAPQLAAVLDVNVTFQQNLGNNNNATQVRVTRQVVKTFQAFVKTHNWVAGPPQALTVHPTGLIYGCTKSPNSSTVY